MAVSTFRFRKSASPGSVNRADSLIHSAAVTVVLGTAVWKVDTPASRRSTVTRKVASGLPAASFAQTVTR